jgi:hypothetical protein
VVEDRELEGQPALDAGGKRGAELVKAGWLLARKFPAPTLAKKQKQNQKTC